MGLNLCCTCRFGGAGGATEREADVLGQDGRPVHQGQPRDAQGQVGSLPHFLLLHKKAPNKPICEI